MTKAISGVILAAGLSRRMGTPKMLLPWGKTTVLGQVIATFLKAGVADLVIVTGGARLLVEAEVEKVAEEFPVRSVYNPHFESGEMLSSLQCGLASLGSQVESALIGLGDQPQLSLAAVVGVISAYQSSCERIIVPSFNNRRGHPWLVQRNFWNQLLEMKPPLTTRDFINKNIECIFYVEADNTITKDMDTPEAYLSEKP